MFDTPDLAPLCLAPFIGVFIGFFAYLVGPVIGSFIEKKTNKQYSWIRPSLLFSFLLIAPIACFASVALEIGSFLPAPWFKPLNNSIVGHWELSSDTVEYIQDHYNLSVQAHELVFNRDGTFHLINAPTFWGFLDTDNPGYERYISGSGTWYLGQEEGSQRLEWILYTQFNVINNSSDNRIMRFYFEGHLPPYTLIPLDENILRFRFNKDQFAFLK